MYKIYNKIRRGTGELKYRHYIRAFILAIWLTINDLTRDIGRQALNSHKVVGIVSGFLFTLFVIKYSPGLIGTGPVNSGDLNTMGCDIADIKGHDGTTLNPILNEDNISDGSEGLN